MRESRSKAENALLDVIKERDDLKALLAPVSKKERNSSPKRSPKGTGSSPLPLLGGTTPSKDAHAADGQAAERAALAPDRVTARGKGGRHDEAPGAG